MGLVVDVNPPQGWGDDTADIVYRCSHTLALVALGISIAELKGLPGPR